MQVPPVKSLSGMGFSSVFKRTFDSNSENRNFANGLVLHNNYEKISAQFLSYKIAAAQELPPQNLSRSSKGASIEDSA